MAVLYQFKIAGAYDNNGATQSGVNSAYANTNLAGTVSVDGNGIQYWTVPYNAIYKIEATGGNGGTNPRPNSPYGGNGARMSGEFNLTAGQVLRVIVGNSGGSGSTDATSGGGGGASAVSIQGFSTPLIVAAGGGGATTNDITQFPTPGNAGNWGDIAGLWGIGSNTANYYHPGGSGASWSQNGADGSGPSGSLSSDRIGKALNASAKGGENTSTASLSSGYGGFGGGGGGGRNNGTGGGGGGYSGGDGGHYTALEPGQQGSGGGSFNAGANATGVTGGNGSAGYVNVTMLNVAPVVSGGALSLTTIHKDSVTISATLNDIDGLVQYRIFVANTQVYPSSGFTAFANSPVYVNYIIPNTSFALGSNEVRVEYRDVELATGNWRGYVTKTDLAPSLLANADKYSVHKDNSKISVSITDPEADTIKYKVSVNGVIKVDWTALLTSPQSFDYVVQNSILVFGNNEVKIETADEFGVYNYTTLTINKSNANPVIASVILTSPSVHKQDSTMSVTISDAEQDTVQYCVWVGGVKKVDWTAFRIPTLTFDYLIRNSELVLGITSLKVEVKDDFGGYTAWDGSITKYNNVPIIASVVLTNQSVHKQDSTMTVRVIDADQDAVQYCVWVGGVKKLDWTDFRISTMNFDFLIRNSELVLGVTSLKVEVRDEFGAYTSWDGSITKYNNAPVISNLVMDGLTARALINDPDNDTVKYRIYLNDIQMYPSDGYTSFYEAPLNIQYGIPLPSIKIGIMNVIRVDVVDDMGGTRSQTVSFKGDYYSLLFTDANDIYYSTSIGEILKYLDFGTLLAGQTSEAVRIYVKNNLNYPVENLQVRVDPKDFTNHTDDVSVLISRLNAPFAPEEVLLYPEEVATGGKISFYLIVSTKKTAKNGGMFDIYVKGEQAH